MNSAKMLKTISRLLAVLCLVLTASVGADPVAWEDLSDKERQILSKFKDQWGGLSADRQWAIRKGLSQWKSMDGKQRREANDSFKKWKGMIASQ
ncbi:MAG: DUF3106 domain-containing protein, partial [Gammaproteobacteria bacterium]|nr:DUF3106 domain-containing protein [Gammaproteobacteria bacterium]